MESAVRSGVAAAAEALGVQPVLEVAA